jgi:hypothetical protein
MQEDKGMKEVALCDFISGYKSVQIVRRKFFFFRSRQCYHSSAFGGWMKWDEHGTGHSKNIESKSLCEFLDLIFDAANPRSIMSGPAIVDLSTIDKAKRPTISADCAVRIAINACAPLPK